MKHEVKSERASRSHLFIIPFFLGFVLFYAWLASSGSRGSAGVTTYYYSYLAEAFTEGNLFLASQPDPRLLALDNPYDPQDRLELQKFNIIVPIDFSLYEGKFYLYWGPVPGLILAAGQYFAHQPLVGDFFLAFVFAVGIFLAQSMLILIVWHYCFQTLPRWILLLSIFLAGLIWPITLLRYENNLARIYQAAIAAGQFFLISGLLMTFTAIAKPTISNWKLAFAGLLWVLAIGSRHLLVAPIFLIGITTVFWVIQTNADFVVKVRNLISLSLPTIVGCVGLGWYNWARFDSITETGFSYALAGVNLQKHSTELFSSLNIIQNLYNYLCNAPGFTSMFPFVSMIQGNENIDLPFYTSPKFYYAQPMTGLLYIFPFALFAIIPLITLLSDLFKRNLETRSNEDRSHKLITWIALNLLGSSFIAFSLMLFFFWAGMRYMGDFLPLLTILSIIGFWQGYLRTKQKPSVKILYILSGIILGAISITISTLLAISTVYG